MAAIVHELIHQKFVFVSIAGIVIFSYFAFLTSATSVEPHIGSLILSDLDETLLNQSGALQQEVKQALKAVKKDDVGCLAPIIFRFSSDLHHARIAPFSCFFTDNKSLTIHAKNWVKLPDGEMVPLEQLIKRKHIPPGAALQFELTDWKWTDANRKGAADQAMNIEGDRY